MDPLVGRTLGPYELQARLGAGGMGTVYRAEHRRLRQQRAVKVLPHNLAADPTFVQRFEREARLAAELRHPNIVVVHDVDDANGIYYIAMELLEGRSLRELIRDDWPVPVDRALGLLQQLAQALDFAHGRGVVHRDIKPANVFVGTADHVTLVDFGIARAADGTVLTGSGIMGTPEYMAPEMLRGETAGQSTDLYALGIVAFELLTGRLPFVGANTPSIMYAQVHTPSPALRTLKPDLPEALEAVMARQLSKQSTERYDSAVAFVAALRQAAGQRQQTAVDLDNSILDGIAATLAVGDWRRALQDFERLADPASMRAAALRHRAELLRAQTEMAPRTPDMTPPPVQPAPRQTPIPPPSHQSSPGRRSGISSGLTPPPMPVIRVPGGYGGDPSELRRQEQRRRLLLMGAGGIGAVALLGGGLWLGALMRPNDGSGPGATPTTGAASKPDPNATRAAEETRTAEQTRAPAAASAVAAATNSAAARAPATAASTAAPALPQPAAAPPAAASTTQTRIGFLLTLSQQEVLAQRARAMMTLWDQSFTAQASKAGPPGIEQFRGIQQDDLGTPAGAIAAVNKLINEDKVHIIVSLGSNTTTMAAAPIAQQARVPFVSVFVESPPLDDFSKTDVFRFVFPAPRGAATTSPPQLMPGITERVYLAVKKAGEGGADKMTNPLAIFSALDNLWPR